MANRVIFAATRLSALLLVGFAFLEVSANAQQPLTPDQRVPAWAKDAIFYQIFPERFRNGDPSNDPTKDSLEFPDIVPDNWAVTPWTDDWYSRAEWEKATG